MRERGWNLRRAASDRTLARAVSLVCAIVVVAAVLATSQWLHAQDVTEPALKAGFIYNFAKFTEWPATGVSEAAPLLLCVLGDTAVGEALEKAVKGRALAGRDLNVAQLKELQPTRVCHVLYVSGVSVGRAAQVIEEVRDGPVLTISDLEGFTERGGIAQCFFVGGQLRFRVQQESAQRARLRISSRLLVLARIR